MIYMGLSGRLFDIQSYDHTDSKDVSFFSNDDEYRLSLTVEEMRELARDLSQLAFEIQLNERDMTQILSIFQS